MDYGKIRTAVDVLRKHGFLEGSHQRWMLDIGANIGTVCVPLVMNEEFAGALAFEPEPRNFRLLLRNICQNGLEGLIKALQIGLSEAPGKVSFELSRDNYGDHRVRVGACADLPDRYGESGRRLTVVPVDTLDAVIERTDLDPHQLGLIFLDVQGHE
jgi:FkbM family methyltransferase